MTREASVQTAEARSQSYALFATIFRRPLDAAQIRALRGSEMLAALSAAGIEIAQRYTRMSDEQLRDALAIEFTHIFASPEGKIMPYEGLMLGGQEDLKNKATSEVEKFMASVGYRVLPESGEFADHVAVELTFMADVAGREADALRSGDEQTAQTAHRIQRDFLGAHLGRWMNAFADAVEARDEGNFYRQFARAAAEFIENDGVALASEEQGVR